MFESLKKSEIFIIFCVWFAAAVSLLAENINAIALYAVLPIAFLTTIFFKWNSGRSKYLSILIILYLWILFSVLWATDTQMAMRQMRQILGAFIYCVIIVKNGQNPKCIIWFYITYIIIIMGDWYYAYNNIFGVVEFGEDRLNDEKLNANTLAYHTFYVTMTLFVLGEMTENRIRKAFRILFLTTIPLSWITAMLTASRQVLLLQVPFIACLLFVRYLKNSSSKNKIAFVIMVMVLGLLSFRSLMSAYEDSTLSQRMEMETKEDSRVTLAKDAFEVGVEHFPLGVGPGNYIIYSYNKHFSHNTYLELFANEGIVGVLIYVWLMLSFMHNQIRRYKKYKDNFFLVFALFGFFYIADGIFYSFYQVLWLIGFFMLVATHSEVYYRENYVDNQNIEVAQSTMS